MPHDLIYLEKWKQAHKAKNALIKHENAAADYFAAAAYGFSSYLMACSRWYVLLAEYVASKKLE